MFWAAFNAMKPYGRVLICGLISDYNHDAPPPEPDRSPHLLRMIALKRLIVKGVMVADYWHLRPRFLQEVGGMIRDGRLTSKEYVVEGIENAGRAMIDMLSGRNFGKTVVRIADAPFGRP